MRNHKKQSGFSIVEVAIAVAVVGLMGYVGYTAYSRMKDNSTSNDSAQVIKQNPIASDVPSAPEIKSTTDLVTAEKTLDGTSVDSTGDTTQLDADLATF